MTDRELLELAAKAASLEDEYSEWSDKIEDYDSPHYGEPAFHRAGKLYQCFSWNPLIDDGDALRLAVKLGIDEIFTVAIVGGKGYVAACDANLELSGTEENLLEDPYAATRRAIVRAAAEIGRNMK